MTETTPGQSQSGQFKEALTKLASDSDYRQRTTSNPTLIVQDFHLSDHELQALRQVAEMSGADTAQIDSVVSGAGQGLQDVNVNVSCCCCCCCGETGVTVPVAS